MAREPCPAAHAGHGGHPEWQAPPAVPAGVARALNAAADQAAGKTVQRTLHIASLAKSTGLSVELPDVMRHHAVRHQGKAGTLERRLDVRGQRKAPCVGETPRVNRQAAVELVWVCGVRREEAGHLCRKGKIFEPCRQGRALLHLRPAPMFPCYLGYTLFYGASKSSFSDSSGKPDLVWPPAACSGLMSSYMMGMCDLTMFVVKASLNASLTNIVDVC